MSHKSMMVTLSYQDWVSQADENKKSGMREMLYLLDELQDYYECGATEEFCETLERSVSGDDLDLAMKIAGKFSLKKKFEEYLNRGSDE